MRSNWEIHGRVPCRAWQAAGIGMGEGRERHCWAGCKGTAQAAQEQPCSFCTAPHLTCPWQTLYTTARVGVQEEHTPDQPWAFLCWGSSKVASPPPAPSLNWAPHHSGGGEKNSFIGYLCPSGCAFWTNSSALQCPTKPQLCCWVWEIVPQLELKRKKGNLKVFCYKHRCRW